MSVAPEETTTIRIPKFNHAKLKRLAALEGMTFFELMDRIAGSVIANEEMKGRVLAAPSNEGVSLVAEASRRAARRLISHGEANSEHEDAPPVSTSRHVPDYEKGIKKGHKRQISHTIAPDLLQWVDEAACEYGMARAGVINLCLAKARKRGLFN